jgi:hypothetical protein
MYMGDESVRRESGASMFEVTNLRLLEDGHFTNPFRTKLEYHTPFLHHVFVLNVRYLRRA